ncbi:MAG: bifunctional hydroxymethylpyrimidine kinase/phosphomethylpyrimidine kinase [Elusimicrobiales bacterium]|jgi:hydroxymethylpyrimidine/phosphomethylpyrimidine kinase|nr:bifunctional hydroxymethylpyrimidine kinase/phosphomethylpyrimidine kinase [Elusimicrobiales bacterium]
MKIPVVLSIAGLDPSGGAGIIADIKTFSYFKVYGMGVITAITAQNTFEIKRVKAVEKKLFDEELFTVLNDIKPTSLKVSMLPCDYMVGSIKNAYEKYKLKNIVIDPVMISKHGNELTSKKVIKTMISELFPITDVLTPNITEAEFITGLQIKNYEDATNAARSISYMGVKYVLIKGGHANSDESNDILYHSGKTKIFRHKRINTKNTHGTGCTLSAAISANLSKGYTAEKAVDIAIRYTNRAIKNSLNIGSGNGPLNHFL